MDIGKLILDIAMRYIHIVSAIVAVGGLMFTAFCLSPAVRMLDDAFRDQVRDLVGRRFRKVVNMAIGGLIISGVYNWVQNMDAYKAMGPKGNALIGTKVLLAFILFAIVWGEGMGLIKVKNPAALLMIKLLLALVVILLGGILKTLGAAA